MKRKSPSKRKNPAAAFGNCITVERETVLTNGEIASAKNTAYEEKHRYLMIPIEPRGMSYKRIREGQAIPAGAKVHFGKI